MHDATRIEKWVKQIDIDYYSYFIKAWIPFNAWYRDNFPSLDSDRAIINEIKSTGNRFRDSIIVLLNDQGPEGVTFRTTISNLHNSLNSVSISCKQKHNPNYNISLTEICVENNPTDQDQITRRNINYYVRRERNNGKTLVTVSDSNNVTKMNRNFPNYSEGDLQSDSQYSKLTHTQQSTLINLYKNINPWYPCNLLFDVSRDSEHSSIKCGNINFTSDNVLLAKGIIECLYLLRNTLLHGELTPNEAALRVYNSAYDLLAIIVKKLG